MACRRTMPSRIAVTLGDPAGIGPEVILMALADAQWLRGCEVTVIGSRSVIQTTYQSLSRLGIAAADPDELSTIDIPLPGEIAIAQGDAVSGAASFAYLDRAIALTLAGQFQAIVTGPIAKSAWKAAGHFYPGQTELLAERAGVSEFGMLFVARSPHSGWTLRTLLATTHIPLRAVADTLSPDLMSRKLALLVRCLHQQFNIASPRIAIAGLNPHSGEQGQLGREEQDWLIPWIEQQRSVYPSLTLDGPVPPDTLWVKPTQAWYGANPAGNIHDAYLALYHDQGLIPVKAMAFDRAVNTTIGLPFIRTSPDHGTAFDIAGRGLASPTSMRESLQLAVGLCEPQAVNV